MSKKKLNIKVVAQNARIDWNHLNEAHKSDKFSDGRPKFSVDFLLHKKQHADVIKEIDDAVAKILADEGWAKNTVKAFPYVDAASKVNEDGSAKVGYDDQHVFVTAKSDDRPVAKSRDNVTLSGEEIVSTFYRGCRCHVSFDVYPARAYRKLCVSLRAVKFFADDEPFGNRINITDDEFGDEDEGEGESVM